MEAAGVFAEIAFQRCLIDSHALFSPLKMDSPLKFEPPVNQILKGADHEADTEVNWACFAVLSLSICGIVTSSSANRSADRSDDERSNLKMLSVYDL
jgi:hypothetical protein